MGGGSDDDVLSEARACYGRHEWGDARAGFFEAQASGGLAPPDLERLAWSWRWLEHPGEFLETLERAETAYRDHGDHHSAARTALEQARHHKQMLSDAVAMTACVRALDHLRDQPESAERAQALWFIAFPDLESGELDAARATLEEARDIARRVGAEGVEASIVASLAHVEAATGSRDRAAPLFDQAASLAMRNSVEPIHAGHTYCAAISGFRSLCDWQRATEWTEVSERYCEREAITGYSGLCRFHRAEIDRLHGRLQRAEERVDSACEELLRVNRYSAGWGFGELVDIRVRRGDLNGAETALARAVELGSDGQPGRGRLLLAKGTPEAALKSLERTLAEPGFLARESRVFLLPVHVTASLAVGDTEAAQRSITELGELAEWLGTEAPAAAAAVARGELALHVGDHGLAVRQLRDGIRRWCVVDAPYEAAQARILLARALRGDGDEAAAGLELEAAHRALAEIGAGVEALMPEDRQAPSAPRPERTFMFSDIVSSTRLAETIGDAAWASLLAWHDRTLRSIFAAHDGEEVKHGGDGFFVAFGDPDAAIDCAAAIQRALADHREAHGFAPTVRIGLHTGEATARDGDYFGSAVTRASRIADATGPAEVVASAELVGCCGRTHPLADRRALDLKGIGEPVAVHVIAWESAHA